MNTPIQESIVLSDKYPSVIDRYFSRRYVRKEEDNDTCLLFHSNKICLVTLAKSHAIFKKNLGIRKVNFKVSEKLDRSSNKVVGKGKRGGQHVIESSVLCLIECDDGSVHNIMAGVKGKLVEINDHLVDDPQLLLTKAETNGYIAVILQKLGVESDMSNSISKEEYEKLVE